MVGSILDKNVSLLDEYDIPIEIKMPIMQKNYKSYDKLKQFCHALNNTIFIDCAGNVYPCISWQVKSGNIYENTMEEIWTGSEEMC